MVRSIASFILSWLSNMLCQVGQLASSKSAIQQLAPLGEDFFHPPPVLPRELRHESDRLGREYPGELLGDLGRELYPLRVGARLIRHDRRLLSTASRARLL